MLSAIIKPVLDLCRYGIAAWKKRRNPARAQVQRLPRGSRCTLKAALGRHRSTTDQRLY
jgi:hypothetical protein